MFTKVTNDPTIAGSFVTLANELTYKRDDGCLME
jgi:hypothetical protein